MYYGQTCFITIVFLTLVSFKVLDFITIYTLEPVNRTAINMSRQFLANLTGELSTDQAKVFREKCFYERNRQGNRTFHSPKVIVIGAKKCSTEALYTVMRMHPQIQSPFQEIHYFDLNYDKSMDWYLSQLPPTLPDEIAVEKSPRYFVEPGVPERIHKMDPNVKLVLSVNEPVKRTLSDYVHEKFEALENWNWQNYPPIEKYLLEQDTGRLNASSEFLQPSMFKKHLSRWLRYFPMDQILIVDGEETKYTPWTVMEKVEDFLDLPHHVTMDNFYYNATKGFYCFQEFCALYRKCLGKTKGRPPPDVKPEVVKMLTDFFRPLNEEFFRLIGRRFDWNYVDFKISEGRN